MSEPENRSTEDLGFGYKLHWTTPSAEQERMTDDNEPSLDEVMEYIGNLRHWGNSAGCPGRDTKQARMARAAVRYLASAAPAVTDDQIAEAWDATRPEPPSVEYRANLYDPVFEWWGDIDQSERNRFAAFGKELLSLTSGPASGGTAPTEANIFTALTTLAHDYAKANSRDNLSPQAGYAALDFLGYAKQHFAAVLGGGGTAEGAE